MKEIKMTVHGRWASYTYLNQKPLVIALSRWEEAEGERR
jgi:hypothetical protein